MESGYKIYCRCAYELVRVHLEVWCTCVRLLFLLALSIECGRRHRWRKMGTTSITTFSYKYFGLSIFKAIITWIISLDRSPRSVEKTKGYQWILTMLFDFSYKKIQIR